MVLRDDGDFAHTPADRARGIAHRGAEQFRQRNEGHGPRSSNNVISKPVKSNRILRPSVLARVTLDQPPTEV
jgi:hypothetical protein